MRLIERIYLILLDNPKGILASDILQILANNNEFPNDSTVYSLLGELKESRLSYVSSIFVEGIPGNPHRSLYLPVAGKTLDDIPAARGRGRGRKSQTKVRC